MKAIWLLALALACAPSRATDVAASSMEEMVRAEGKSLSERWGLQLRLELTSEGELFSSPQGRVSVGMSRLQHDLGPLPEHERRQLVRFYLAHEFWHQWQFHNPLPVADLSDGDRARLAECQADVMAATTVGDAQVRTIEDPQALYGVLVSLVRSLGANAHGTGTHPPREQRLAAVRAGLLRTAFEAAAGRTEQDLLLRVADVRASEAMPAWSERVCRKILRLSAGALALVELKLDEVRWNRPSTNPFVEFAGTYRNRSTRVLDLQGTVYLVAPYGATGSELLGQQIIDARHIDAVLQPDAVLRVRERLTWSPDMSTPSLVFDPLEENSLYAAHFVGESRSCLANPKSPKSAESAKLKQILTAYADNVHNGFAPYRSRLLGSTRNSTAYFSKLHLPHAYSELIVIDSGHSFAVMDLYKGSSREEASAIFLRSQATLARWCGKDPDSLLGSASFRADEFSGAMGVRLELRDKAPKFNVALTLNISPLGSKTTSASNCLAGGLPAKDAQEAQLANSLFALSRDSRSGFRNMRGNPERMSDGTYVYSFSSDGGDRSDVTFFEDRRVDGRVIARLLPTPAPRGGISRYEQIKALIEDICPSSPKEEREIESAFSLTYSIRQLSDSSELNLTVLKELNDSIELHIQGLRPQ